MIFIVYIIFCFLSVNIFAKHEIDQSKNVDLSKRFLDHLNIANSTDGSDLHKVISLLAQKVSLLENDYGKRISALESHIVTNQKISGSTYVRWGRKSCPTNTTATLYTGFTSGSYYGTPGGAANFLCLPDHPDVGKQIGTSAGALFGTEFFTGSFGPNTQYQDVPCSVCHLTDATSPVMISGRSDCPQGMKMEYRGNLAVGEDHSPSEYICIDENPEHINGGQAYSGKGRLIFPVVSKCGPLPCPPYHNNMSLSCVVCSI